MTTSKLRLVTLLIESNSPTAGKPTRAALAVSYKETENSARGGGGGGGGGGCNACGVCCNDFSDA